MTHALPCIPSTFWFTLSWISFNQFGITRSSSSKSKFHFLLAYHIHCLLFVEIDVEIWLLSLSMRVCVSNLSNVESSNGECWKRPHNYQFITYVMSPSATKTKSVEGERVCVCVCWLLTTRALRYIVHSSSSLFHTLALPSPFLPSLASFFLALIRWYYTMIT